MKEHTMNKYTIVLLRPDYLCGVLPVRQDVYVAYVEANNIDEGIMMARREAWEGDREAGYEQNSSLDYALVVAFAGVQPVIKFGWQE